ncbi:hypothetical protein Afil01_65050 [Actinorhabdospora filicis]|uniref:Uncharacterized protein n=1 Tax=Actinorhabdospora filicis TaxID=1785913 RepID=A0A9W6WD31_9ACTN|nr:hypothetical protein Afil01_65050 [Actinorhabdospora filicis]
MRQIGQETEAAGVSPPRPPSGERLSPARPGRRAPRVVHNRWVVHRVSGPSFDTRAWAPATVRPSGAGFGPPPTGYPRVSRASRAVPCGRVVDPGAAA